MQLTYRYKLRPSKEQNVTMIEWLNLCRRHYNYRLSQCFRWWESTRTPINSCPLEENKPAFYRFAMNVW
ncbi:MAG: helix-turn-helix domain-containing protein [Xenococcaceae cyanobacterium]